MDAAHFAALALACAPQISFGTTQALVQVESSFNPWAIGLVGGALVRQPRHRGEAIATARALYHAGSNFSVGLAQINRHNFQRLGLALEMAFDPCLNLGAMQTVLGECYDRSQASVEHQRRRHPQRRAPAQTPDASSGAQPHLHRALSCYYSGNFSTSFRHGYVTKLVAAAAKARASSTGRTYAIPARPTTNVSSKEST